MRCEPRRKVGIPRGIPSSHVLLSRHRSSGPSSATLEDDDDYCGFDDYEDACRWHDDFCRHEMSTNGPSKNSIYYCVPELREEVEKRGWKPKGEKRSAEQAHPGPTPKKNRQTDALPSSPAVTHARSSQAPFPRALSSTAKTKHAPKAIAPSPR
eukprot:2272696-Rhodomonas_salina.1